MTDRLLINWRVLLIDDDEDDYLLTKSMLNELQSRKVELDWAPTYEDGYRQLWVRNYDAVLVDYDLGPRTGIELIRELVAQDYSAPLILYTCRGSYEVDVEAMQAGATLYLTKTETTPLLFERSIRYAIERKQIEIDLQAGNERLATELAERKRVEEDLQRQQEWLLRAKQEWERTFDSVPDLIAILDVHYRIIRVNRPMAQRLGLTPEQCVGLCCFECVHDSRQPHHSCPHTQTLRDGQEHIVEVHEEHLGGDFLVSTSPLFDNQGQVTGSVHVARDISTIKQTEKALRATNEALLESQARLNRSQEIAHLGSWELDLENDCLTWSDEVYRIFGLQPQEFGATYEAFLEAVHPEDRATVDAAYSGSIQEGRDSYEIEHRVVRKSNGEVRIVHEKCEHIRDASGRIIRSIGMVHDITERKQAEAALKDYAEQLKRSNQGLEDFAFIASHDLREPLRKIQLFGDRLQAHYSRELDEEGKDYIERMQNAAKRMQSMLDGLLTYSRISTQSSQFTKVDLPQIASDVLSDMEMSLIQTGGKVELEQLPVIEADPVQMRQLFQNLIGNALKFHRPEVPPKVRISSQPVSDNKVELIFEDNGIGFDMGCIDHLFKPFHRLLGISTYEGNGMGLAICKKIVERHNGAINVTSIPGQGSTFIVTLPMQ